MQGCPLRGEYYALLGRGAEAADGPRGAFRGELAAFAKEGNRRDFYAGALDRAAAAAGDLRAGADRHFCGDPFVAAGLPAVSQGDFCPSVRGF